MVSTIRHRQRWQQTFRFWLVMLLLLLSLTPAQLAMAGSYNPTITSDGVVGSSEWQSNELVATESADDTHTLSTTNYGLGTTSNLDRLWLTWDSNNLYLRIDGAFSTAQERGFVAFLDVNYTTATANQGPSNVSLLNHSGATAGTLDGLITLPDFSDSVTAFEADYGLGSVGGVSVADDRFNIYAGLRSWGGDGGNGGATTNFSPLGGITLTLGNLTTISGTNVYTTAEAILPWSVLYADQLPGKVLNGATLGVVVAQAHVASSGTITKSYESLPTNTSGTSALTRMYTVTIDANADSYPDVGVKTGQANLAANSWATASQPNNASTNTSAKTLDGRLDDWHVNEFIGAGTDGTGNESPMRYHVTWDASNVYIAFAGVGNGKSESIADHFNVAIDTDVICSDDDNMNEMEGVSFNNSAEPDFLYTWRTSGNTPMFGRYVANGVNWDASSTTGGGVSSNSNPAIVEVRIPRSELNNLANGAAFYLWTSDSTSADFDAYGATPDAAGSNRLNQFARWSAMNSGVTVNTSEQGSDICVTYADVSIAKNVTPSGALLPGQPVTYTLTYTNTGPDTAADVEINDFMPEQVIIDSISSSGPAVTLLSNYQWGVADIPASNSGSITLVGTVASALNTAATLFNTATITASNDTDDSNNSVTVSSDLTIPVLTLEHDSYSQEENDQLLNIIAMLTPANPYASVFVNYEMHDETSTYGDDYADERPGDLGTTLLFPAGTTTQTIPLRITDDPTDEMDETLSVVLVTPVGATLGGTSSAQVTIVDNDEPPTPSVTIGDLSINESGGTLNLPVSIDVVGQGDITVVVATASNTAVAPADYASRVLTGVIPLGNMSTVLTGVPIVDDNIDEENEIFFVEIISVTNALVGNDTAAITIVDNDITPTLSINTAAVSEALGLITFTATIDRPSSRNITGFATTSAGSAASPADFTVLVNAPFTIQAGSTSTVISVMVNNDTLYETNETFSLALSNVSYATVSGGPTSATINNDDAQPSVTIADVAVNEDSGAMGFVISLNTASGITVNGTFNSADSTASAPADYSAASNLVFTIPAGATSTTVVVTLVADNIDEADETLQGNISGVSNASVADNQATGTILDDDLPPLVSIGDLSVNEGAGTLSIPVSLSAVSQQNITVVIATSPITAVAPADYAHSVITGVIPIGSVTATFNSVSIVDDNIDEEDETLAVQVVTVTNALVGDGTALVTIVDNDPTPSLTINTPSASEALGMITFTVSINRPSSRNITGLATTTSSLATSPADFTALVNAPFTIPAGSTSTTIQVVVNNDALYENNETFVLDVSNVANATVTTGRVSGVINNDDAPPILTIADASANEDSAALGFVVSLNTPSGINTSGTFTTSNGTASAPSDYSALTNLVFLVPAGSTSTLVTVTTVVDDIDEPNETLQGYVSGVSAATVADGIALGTILDDDLPPVVSISDTIVSEVTNSMVFTISMAGGSVQNVTGTVSTSDGNAVAGQDYQAFTSNFTIPAGSRSTTVAVTITNDALDENNETFTAILSNISNGTLGDGSGTGTINDDDLPPTLQVTPLVSGSEGEVRTFSITLSSPSGLPISGQAALVDGSAQFSSDYSWREPVGGAALPQSSSFSLASGETSKSFEVVMVDDVIFEGNESFSIEVSNVQNATVGSSTSSGTVVENDTAPGLSIADGRAYETDGNMVFTITLNMVSAVVVNGVVNTTNYSAIGGDDYTALVNTPFTIQPGSTSVTVNVAMLNDFTLEAIETFTVTLGSIQNAIALDGTAIGTITDDDSTGTGTLGVTLDVTPDSTQNFKIFRNFGSLFYMDDEPGGLQRDTYTNSITYTLSPGRYIITPSIPSGWFLSGINCMPANAAIVNNVAVSITLPGGGQSVGCTYGIVRAVTINTRAYYDANRSGTYNALEAAVPTVTMQVYVTPSLTTLYSGVTNKYGKYNFAYIRPQPYTVCASNWPAPYTGATQPIPYNVLYGKPCYTVNLQPGTAANLYYGFSPVVIAADEPTDALFFPIGSIQSGVVISTLPDVEDENGGYDEQVPVDTDVDLPIEVTDLKPEDIEVVTVRKVFLPVINR